MLSNVQGTFSAGETVTGDSSNTVARFKQTDMVLKVSSFDFLNKQNKLVWQDQHAYTADTKLDSTYTTITGNISIANSTRALIGKGTLFTTELKIGDSVSFTNDGGSTVTGIVKYIVSQTSATLTNDVGSSDVATGVYIN